MKSAIIEFPGSNCCRDVKEALTEITGHKPLMIWHNESDLPVADLYVLPGGFSWGDHLRAGAIAARSVAVKELLRNDKKWGYILGICNGFQILLEAQILRGALLCNKDLRFICHRQHLRVENSDSIFTKDYAKRQVIELPVAHKCGNYFIGQDGLKFLEDNDMIGFRYCDEQGLMSSPNGSVSSIAGIFSKNKKVLGLMPHPERHSRAFHYNRDGLKMFSFLC